MRRPLLVPVERPARRQPDPADRAISSQHLAKLFYVLGLHFAGVQHKDKLIPVWRRLDRTLEAPGVLGGR